LKNLEIRRVSLKKRRDILLPIFFGLPILGIVLTFYLQMNHPFLVLASFAIPAFIYEVFISFPFQDIREIVKLAILKEYMKAYYPDLTYTYQEGADNGKKIVKKANLINFHFAKEEDVLKGSLFGSEFYISELHLSSSSGDDSRTVFKGILFALTIPDKDFPNAEIRTGSGNFFRNLFGLDDRNEEFDFSYTTDNKQKFIEQLGPLFPFIQYLSKSSGDLQIRTEKNRIVVMMDSNMQFLDAPSFSLGKSFFNKEYNQELSKQLNTLFFIVESFTNNLEKSEILERLELKILETIDQTG